MRRDLCITQEQALQLNIVQAMNHLMFIKDSIMIAKEEADAQANKKI